MANTVAGTLLTGIHSARPTSGVTAGTLYSCTTHTLIYQTSDTGSTWTTWAAITPITTQGDLIAGGASGVPGRLAAVATGKSLVSAGVSTAPTWGYHTLHGARATSGSTTALTTAGTAYAIALSTEDFDTDAYHDTVTNNSRITVPSGLDGYYLCIAQCYVPISDAAGAYLDLKIRLSGASGTVIAQKRDYSRDGNPIIQCSGVYNIAAAGYIEMYAQCSVNSSTVDATASRLTMVMLGV